MEERRFPRSFEALTGIHEFAGDFLHRAGIGDEHGFAVTFALEEIFTNMVKYHAGATQDISVGLERNGDRLRIVVSDFDVEPFDITKVPDPPVDLPLDDRKPGGLGLFLTRKVMDSVEYEYQGRTSRVILTKRVG